MSVMNFILLVIVLAFGIGFFVAALIWFISWVISPDKKNKNIFASLKEIING